MRAGTGNFREGDPEWLAMRSAKSMQDMPTTEYLEAPVYGTSPTERQILSGVGLIGVSRFRSGRVVEGQGQHAPYWAVRLLREVQEAAIAREADAPASTRLQAILRALSPTGKLDFGRWSEAMSVHALGGEKALSEWAFARIRSPG